MKKEVLNIVHLHIIYKDYYTGVDRYLEMYNEGINSYNNLKVHSVLLTNDKGCIFPRIEYKNGILSAIIPLPLNSNLLFMDTYWKSKVMNVITEMLFPYLSKKQNLIFQYHNLFLSDLSIALKNKFGGKILTHLHCLPWKYSFNRNIKQFNKLYELSQCADYETFKEIENSKVQYKESDAIICLSKVAQDYLINIHQINKDQTIIIQNGLKLNSVSVKPRKERENNKILYVGKIGIDKGTFEMLDALKIVKNKGYDFTLILAGSCSPKIINRIHSDYYYLNIEILGQIPLDKLTTFYKTSTMGIIPSLFEQCSYVALEMAMFGLPIIVSDVDALSEMFEHKKNALLSPILFDSDFGIYLDKNLLANNIIQLLSDKKMRERLSFNIRKLYEERYTLKKMIDNTINLYEQLNEKKLFL